VHYFAQSLLEMGLLNLLPVLNEALKLSYLGPLELVSDGLCAGPSLGVMSHWQMVGHC
jgi:hypothetical protein